jgi:methylthioribose-1-phosphate isomerase
VANPAFDVTPNELVTAIITESGVARQPLGRTLPRMLSGVDRRRAARAAAKAEPRRERRR